MSYFGACVLLQLSGSTLTTPSSTTYTVFESGNVNYVTVAAFDSTHAIVCYQAASDTKGKCASITRSGTVLTVEAAIEIETDTHPGYTNNGIGHDLSVTVADSVTAIVCYDEPAYGGRGRCTKVLLSGSTITEDSHVTFTTSDSKLTSVAAFGTHDSVVCFQDDSDGDKGKCSHIYSGEASLYGDPHIRLAHGGRTDFRGTHGKVYNLLSAPNISFSVETTTSHFYQDYGKQLVHGSHFRKAHFVLRSTEGKLIKVASYAHDCPFHVFKSYEPWGVYTQGINPGLHAPGVDAFWSERGRVTVRAAGWEVNVTCRTLYKPVSGTNRMTLDLTMRTLDDVHALAAKYGHANVQSVAPHGIIGQSFAPGAVARDGKLDNYTGSAEVTTSAQAEGAIEGVYTDYEVKAWSPYYMYSRFDAKPDPSKTSPSASWGAAGAYAGTEDTYKANAEADAAVEVASA